MRSASAQTLPSPVSSTGGQPYDGGGQASLCDAQPADSGYVWAEALPPPTSPRYLQARPSVLIDGSGEARRDQSRADRHAEGIAETSPDHRASPRIRQRAMGVASGWIPTGGPSSVGHSESHASGASV